MASGRTVTYGRPHTTVPRQRCHTRHGPHPASPGDPGPQRLRVCRLRELRGRTGDRPACRPEPPQHVAERAGHRPYVPKVNEIWRWQLLTRPPQILKFFILILHTEKKSFICDDVVKHVCAHALCERRRRRSEDPRLHAAQAWQVSRRGAERPSSQVTSLRLRLPP